MGDVSDAIGKLVTRESIIGNLTRMILLDDRQRALLDSAWDELQSLISDAGFYDERFLGAALARATRLRAAPDESDPDAE